MSHLAIPKLQLVKRDPFARTELMRERVYQPYCVSPYACHWCGGVKTTPRTGLKFLFRFWSVSDGGRRIELKGLFCSNSCERSYHG